MAERRIEMEYDKDEGDGRLDAGLATNIRPELAVAPVRRAKRESKVLLSYWVEGEGAQQTRLCDALDSIGTGWFHIELGVWVGGFLFAEAAELGKGSALSYALIDAAGMDRKWHSDLISTVFIGFAIGNLLAGPLGDKYGRRVCVLGGQAGMVLCSLAFVLFPVPAIIWLGRGIGGMFAGFGIPNCFAMLAEFTPGEKRAQVFCIANFMLSLGVIWVGICLHFLMPDLETGDWKVLCALTDWLPGCILFLGTWYRIPESPHYLALAGRGPETKEALSVMARRNRCKGNPIPESARIEAHAADTLPVREALVRLFGRNHLVKTLACSYLEFSQMMTAFGMAFAVQEVLGEMGESSTSGSGSDNLPIEPALAFLTVESVNLLATAISFILAGGALGNIGVLFLSAVVAAVGCGIASLMKVSLAAGMTGAMLAKLVLLPWGTTQKVVISESYQTQLRVTALAVTGTVGRIGIIISPKIAGGYGFTTFAIFCCVASLLNGMVARTRKETKGMSLEDYDETEGSIQRRRQGTSGGLEVGTAVEVVGGPSLDKLGIIVGFTTSADGAEHSTVMLRGGQTIDVESTKLKVLRGSLAEQIRSQAGGERVATRADV
eukprot:Hpha_TRINITY_DN26669_c0_g1::TRINITY_DN26669_c0_g1_i1::g.86014::m.86014